MKYQYWILRYVPDAVRGEFVNVGVVVVSPLTGESRVKTVQQIHTVVELAPSNFDVRDAAQQSLTRLVNKLRQAGSGPESLPYAEFETVRGMMDRFGAHMNNLIQVSPSRVISAESIDSALDILFKDFVHRAPAQHKRQQYRQRVKQKIEDTYQSLDNLASSVQTSPKVHAFNRRVALDIAVVNNEPRELVRGFSFAGRCTPELQNRLDAWTFHVAGLRDHGGELQLDSAAPLRLPRDVPVIAVVDTPASTEQEDLLGRMKDSWSAEDIDTLTLEELYAHAREVERELVAA